MRFSTAIGTIFIIASFMCSAQAGTPPGDNVKTAEVNQAARVALVEGDVKVFSADKKARQVKVEDLISEGESIVTGADGELHLNMDDGGYLAIRPNTRLRITKFRAKGDDDDTSVIGLLQGSFRAVSGWIGKYNNKQYLIRTPNATIGIRGTDHEPLVVPKGATDQEPGTYDKVNEGGSYIDTPQGRVEVARSQAGFASHDAKVRPRVLADIPRIFRATRNEHLLAGKHAAVQKMIEQHREERRNEIRKKLMARKPGARHESLVEKREAARKARQEAQEAKAEEARQRREEVKKKREEREEAKKGAKE